MLRGEPECRICSAMQHRRAEVGGGLTVKTVRLTTTGLPPS